MRRWIISCKCLIDGKHRPEIQVHLLTKFPVDLVHVSGKLFQQILEAIEHRVQSRLIASEVRAYEIFVYPSIPVVGPPELRNLQQTALCANTLALSILLNQLTFQFLV